MKYLCTVHIALPLEEVVNLWLDQSQFKHWQDGFVSRKLNFGSLNEKGAKSSILFLQGKNKMELEETILESDLPHFILGEYVHKHMTNTQKTCFESLGPKLTMIKSEVVYTQFNGFMIKMMAKLFPGMFKKQSQKWLDQFKAFAEQRSA